MTKKILLILGIILVIGLVAFLIFGYTQKENGGVEKTGFSIFNFLPFGSSEDSTVTSENTNTSSENSNGQVLIDENQPVPRIRKISSEPVAGAVIYNKSTSTIVRFVEKGTGNVYEANSDSIKIERLTNTTIPKIIRAFWLPNASGFLAQTFLTETETIETNFVKLNKNAASSTEENAMPFNTSISSLPTSIKEISIKPDGSKIFYYIIYKGFSNWFTSSPDGTGAAIVYTSPLTEWLPKWVSGNDIFMQTKGSAQATSYTYIFNTQTKSLSKIGVASSGISTSPSNDLVLSLVSNGTKLFLVNNKTATSTESMVNTMAEKCVWLKDGSHFAYCAIPENFPSGDYPDVWYQGLISTQDSIKKVDLDHNIYYEISNLSDDTGEKIDVTNMSLSPDGNYLIFTNKIDGYLWMLKIAKD